MKNKTLLLSCALALAALSHAAVAAEGQGFVRAEAGQSDVEFDVDLFGSESDDDTAYSLRGGYWFHDNFAGEVFYSQLYDKTDGGLSFELSGYGIGVVAKKNFGPNNTGFFVGGRAGYMHMEAKASIVDVSHGEDSSDRGYIGANVGYDFSEVFGLSLNYDFHDGDFENFSAEGETLTLGAEVRF